MFKLALCTLGALLLASTANAAKTPGVRLSWLIGASGTTATYNVWVTTNSSRTAPGAQVTFSNCKKGQQVPLQLASRTRHLSGDRENLMVNKLGQLQWETVKTVPAKGSSHPLHLTLTFKRQGKGAYVAGWPSFCVHIKAVTFRYGDRVQMDAPIK